MRTKVYFVDQTMRDAQQGLWRLMMSTEMILPVAEITDRVGYSDIATVGSQEFTIEVRNLNEAPWERIRVLSRLLAKTPLRGSHQIGSLSSFNLSTPRDIITLWIKRSVANGIRAFRICDYRDEMEKFIMDEEQEKRGHAFCRHADDCNVYVRSKRAGQRALESLTGFPANRVKLEANNAGASHRNQCFPKVFVSLLSQLRKLQYASPTAVYGSVHTAV